MARLPLAMTAFRAALQRPRQLPLLLLLALTPLVSGGAALVHLAANGPRWLAGSFDPDYAYLQNGLSIASGHRAAHPDHPGVLVKAFAAAWLSLRERTLEPGALVAFALGADTSVYTELSLLTIATSSLVSAGIGLATWRSSRSRLAALALSSPALLFPVCLEEMYRLRPEPWLLLQAALLAAWIGHATLAPGRPTALPGALGAGALVGLGVSTKITFAPLGLLLLVLPRGRVLALTTAAFVWALACTAFEREPLGSVAFVARMALHRGGYGTGAVTGPGVAPLEHVVVLLAAVAEVPALPCLLAAALLALVASRRTAPGVVWRAAALTLLGQLALLTSVLRQPSVHYLIPALGLAGLSIAQAHGLARHAAPRPRRGIHALLLAAVIGGGLDSARHTLSAWDRRGLRPALAQPHLERVRAAEQRGCVVVPFYAASLPRFAALFGDSFAGHQWAQELEVLYPGAWSYDLLQRRFVRFGTVTADLPAPCTLLYGTPASLREHPPPFAVQPLGDALGGEQLLYVDAVPEATSG